MIVLFNWLAAFFCCTGLLGLTRRSCDGVVSDTWSPPSSSIDLEAGADWPRFVHPAVPVDFSLGIDSLMVVRDFDVPLTDAEFERVTDLDPSATRLFCSTFSSARSEFSFWSAVPMHLIDMSEIVGYVRRFDGRHPVIRSGDDPFVGLLTRDNRVLAVIDRDLDNMCGESDLSLFMDSRGYADNWSRLSRARDREWQTDDKRISGLTGLDFRGVQEFRRVQDAMVRLCGHTLRAAEKEIISKWYSPGDME